jgi:hypothetical protein
MVHKKGTRRWPRKPPRARRRSKKSSMNFKVMHEFGILSLRKEGAMPGKGNHARPGNWRKPASPVVDGKKVCLRCGIEKRVEDFPKQRQARNGIRPRCKACENAANARYYARNSERIREKARAFNKTAHRRAYARNYVREALRKKRDEAAAYPRTAYCDICQAPGVVCWDHDHRTKRFRGWLCNRCNRCLGLMKDDPTIFRAAVQYLEERKGGYAQERDPCAEKNP